jgi:hypothetical protein
MERTGRGLAAVVAALVIGLGVAAVVVDAAAAQQVPCTPGVYPCPPGDPDPPGPPPPPPAPPRSDGGPARDSLATTGLAIGALLGLALHLLGFGRFLVWVGRRGRRRRARRALARRVRRASAFRRPVRPLPGLWSLST